MPEEKIHFKCLELIQPIGKFYIGVMGHKDLVNISFSDVRRLETENEEREIETYIGIQRHLQKNRVKEISKYVKLVDATFPTGIILSVSSDDIKYDADRQEMIIAKRNNAAKVLDGQHRIAGLENFPYPNEKFQLNVTIFVDMALEDQAIVFSTINKTQTKVNKSLVADLFEFATTRSPQKTAHNIARALNEKNGSPFYGKIKILGSANDKLETITQATFAENLLNYITEDQMRDRDIYKRRGKPEKIIDDNLNRKFFFRNMFIQEKDDKIAQIIWNYFGAVSVRWPTAWNEVRPNQILNKSTGFVALMKFLKNAYLSFGAVGEVIEKKDFIEIFKKINLSDEDFNKQKYIPGAGGQLELYKDFVAKSKIH